MFNPQSNPTQGAGGGGLFGSAPAKQGESLFGSAVASGSGGSLFGSGASNVGGQSLFGSSAGGAGFGGNASAKPLNQPTQSTGGLFGGGQPAAAGQSSGLFGSGAQPQQNLGNTFPQNNQQKSGAQPGGLFGQPQTTSGQGATSNGGSLFSAAGPSTGLAAPAGGISGGGSLFGSAQSQPGNFFQKVENDNKQGSSTPGQPGQSLFGQVKQEGGGFGITQDKDKQASGQQNLFGSSTQPKQQLFGAQTDKPTDQKPAIFGQSPQANTSQQTSEQNKPLTGAFGSGGQNLFGGQQKTDQQNPISSNTQQKSDTQIKSSTFFGQTQAATQGAAGLGQSSVLGGSMFGQPKISEGSLKVDEDKQKIAQQPQLTGESKTSLFSGVSAGGSSGGGLFGSGGSQINPGFAPQKEQEKKKSEELKKTESKIPAFISGDLSQTQSKGLGDGKSFLATQLTPQSKDKEEKKPESAFGQGIKPPGLNFDTQKPGGLFDTQATQKAGQQETAKEAPKVSPLSSSNIFGQKDSTGQQLKPPTFDSSKLGGMFQQKTDEKKADAGEGGLKIPGFGSAQQQDADKDKSAPKNMFAPKAAQEQKQDDQKSQSQSQPTPTIQISTEQKKTDLSSFAPPQQQPPQTQDQQQPQLSAQQIGQPAPQVQQQQQNTLEQMPIENVINSWFGQVRENELFFQQQSQQLLDYEKFIFTCIDQIKKIEDSSVQIRKNYVNNAQTLRVIREDQDDIYRQLDAIERKMDQLLSTGDISTPLNLFNDPYSYNPDHLTAKQSIFANAIAIEKLTDDIAKELSDSQTIMNKATESKSRKGQLVLMLDDQPVKVDDTLNMYYETLLWLENAAVDLRFQVDEVEQRLHQSRNQY